MTLSTNTDIPTWAYRIIMGSMLGVGLPIFSWFIIDGIGQLRGGIKDVSSKQDTMQIEQLQQRVVVEGIKGDVKVLQQSDKDTREMLKDIQRTQRKN